MSMAFFWAGWRRRCRLVARIAAPRPCWRAMLNSPCRGKPEAQPPDRTSGRHTGCQPEAVQLARELGEDLMAISDCGATPEGTSPAAIRRHARGCSRRSWGYILSAQRRQ
jgi:hypothetical protein